MLNRRDQSVVITTRRSSPGFFPEAALEGLHAEMMRQLREEGAHLDAIYYCPHHPLDGLPPYVKQCNCRKAGLPASSKGGRRLEPGSPFELA